MGKVIAGLKRINKKSIIIFASTVILILLIVLPIIYPIFWVPAEYNILLTEPIHSGLSIPIGFAVNVNEMRDNETYRTTGLYHFNSFTPENVMKMGPLQPTQGNFFWDDADYLVDLAESNGIQIHGHCLVWHYQVPEWMENFIGTKEEWRHMLKTHIQTIIGRYKGKIVSWDVVNEAFDQGTFRDTIWYENIGEDYIKDAFIWAHEADPDAFLYYNDYGISENNEKLNQIIDFINDSIQEGVPIHGLGFQAHINADSPTNDSIIEAMELINQLNVKVRVSELDIKMNSDKYFHAYTQRLVDDQSKRYAEIVEAYSHADQLSGISLWGLGDSTSWLRSFNPLEWPLLFDDNLNPKPCALSFKNALDEYF